MEKKEGKNIKVKKTKKADFVFWGLAGLISVLFIVLLFVMFNERVEDWAMGVLGSENKQDTIKFIGFGIAGILAIIGAIAVNKRANAQVKAAESQANAADAQVKNNELIEKGHIQERFKTAVEHLGREQVAARIASFYEFYLLAKDNEELKENIFDILCAHLRQTTNDKEYKKKVGFVDGKSYGDVRHTEEVQSLLDILFKLKDKPESFFVGLKANLQQIFLINANLQEAHLQRANLKGADLRGADLRDAHLQGARLDSADLQNADLSKAKLQGARLDSVRLQDANLIEADLRKVNLQSINLQRAKLWYVKLQGANLQGADLREANFLEANLQEANLRGADLRGAFLQRADLRKARLCRVFLHKAYLQDANLQGADLRDADLEEVRNLETANLSEAKIKRAKFPEGYQPPDDADVISDDDYDYDDDSDVF